MDYTCENCKSRNNWDCGDCWGRHCENFELDESTLSEEEQRLLRVMRQVMREKIREAIAEIKSYAEHSWGGLNEAFELAIMALEIVDNMQTIKYTPKHIQRNKESCEGGK